MSSNISLPECTCARCGHKWFLRKPIPPRVCPNCKSPYWNAESEFKRELDLDMQKAFEIEKELSETVQRCTQDPQYWTEVVEKGWQRMFETSDFPIRDVDRVLQANFPIDVWFVNVYGASHNLATDVARKLSSTREQSRGAEIQERIKEALDWDEVLKGIDEKVAKTLGFLWYAEALSTAVHYTESEAGVQERAWSLLESNLEMTRKQIVELVELATTRIDESNKGAVLWGEIIRFP